MHLLHDEDKRIKAPLLMVTNACSQKDNDRGTHKNTSMCVMLMIGCVGMYVVV